MVAQHGDSFGVQFIDAARAFAPVAHQSRVFQHAEVLGDGGAGNWQPCGELVHRLRVVPQHFEDGQAGGIAQCREPILYVSVHLR